MPEENVKCSCSFPYELIHDQGTARIGETWAKLPLSGGRTGMNFQGKPVSLSLDIKSSYREEHTALLHSSLFKIKLQLCNGAQMSSPFLSPQISLPAQNSSKESFSCQNYNLYLRKHMHSVIKESVQ